jgi:hypothetical protein
MGLFKKGCLKALWKVIIATFGGFILEELEQSPDKAMFPKTNAR